MINPHLIDQFTILDRCYKRATGLLINIEEHIRNSAIEKLGPEELNILLKSMGLASKFMDRRFSVSETCDLLKITRQGLYKGEADGRFEAPTMKQTADGRSVRAGYTLRQICAIREKLGDKKLVLPRSCVLGILNQKGGAQKTTITITLAQYLVLYCGLKVLVIDSDPQSSATTLLGHRPDVDFGLSATMAPFLLQDDSMFEDEAGNLPDDYDPAILSSLEYAVRPTYWTNLDIIPSVSDAMENDIEASVRFKEIYNTFSERTGRTLDRGADMITEGLKPLRAKYDVILIDGTPSLNMSTVNIISACDEVLVPTPAHMIDFGSTISFLGMVKKLTEAMIDKKSPKAMPNLTYLITKFTNSGGAEIMEKLIRRSFGDQVLKNNIDLSDAVRDSANNLNTVYEVTPADRGYSKGLKRAVENYNEVFDEIVNRVICGQMAITQNMFANIENK